jgi:hypothetical protein
MSRPGGFVPPSRTGAPAGVQPTAAAAVEAHYYAVLYTKDPFHKKVRAPPFLAAQPRIPRL